MDKLQKIVSIILKSPLTDKEKVDWLDKVNAVADQPDFPDVVEQLARYFDTFAEKYEKEVSIYDKYLGLLEQFQMEINMTQQQIPATIEVSNPTLSQTQSPIPVQTSIGVPASTAATTATSPVNIAKPLPAEPVQAVSEPPKVEQPASSPSINPLEDVKATIDKLKSEAAANHQAQPVVPVAVI